MRTSYRGVIVASSSLFVRPSQSLSSLLLTPIHPTTSSSAPSYYQHHHHYQQHHYSTSTLFASASARRMISTSTSNDSPPASSSSSSCTRVRIVSYNLLSSKLASPSHFTHTHPDHLQADYRLQLILSKLEKEMTRGFDAARTSSTSNSNDGVDNDGELISEESSLPPPPPTIFALQEVCYPFASALHTFFATRGYHFVTGLYGRPFNGYMGVGIAYPLKDFETINVDICRLSDTRPGGWPREALVEEEEEVEKKECGDTIDDAKAGRGIGNVIQTFVATLIQSIVGRIAMKRLGASSSSSSTPSAEEKKPIDPWDMSENRFNVLLTTVLRHRAIGGGECGNSSGNHNTAFSISNYHMPCAYFAPAVMNIHTDMVAKRVQDLAAESWKGLHKKTRADDDDDEVVLQEGEQPKQTIPYILAGDFNILPDSPQYNILTKGMLDATDPTFPPPKHGMEWRVESSPMNSAYAYFESSEPEFTNYAHLKDDPEPFIGTLDYIFLSKNNSSGERNDVTVVEGDVAGAEWKVHGVQKLPSKEDSGGPFPSEKEPSDHLLIAADLELVSV